MSHRNQIFSVLAILLLALVATPAFAGGPKIVGSWQATSTVDGSTDSAPLLATFGKDGTLVSTGPSTANSVAHGAWKKTGPRQFSATIVFFVYDANGNADLKVTTNDEYQVSQNGQTYTSVFEATLSTLDGTVIGVVTGTSSGTRINVQ